MRIVFILFAVISLFADGTHQQERRSPDKTTKKPIPPIFECDPGQYKIKDSISEEETAVIPRPGHLYFMKMWLRAGGKTFQPAQSNDAPDSKCLLAFVESDGQVKGPLGPLSVFKDSRLAKDPDPESNRWYLYFPMSMPMLVPVVPCKIVSCGWEILNIVEDVNGSMSETYLEPLPSQKDNRSHDPSGKPASAGKCKSNITQDIRSQDWLPGVHCPDT